tara:strand:+ start:2598 stop:2870 length:273 start_codon:yes stop_codon:yes gene_type:complete
MPLFEFYCAASEACCIDGRLVTVETSMSFNLPQSRQRSPDGKAPVASRTPRAGSRLSSLCYAAGLLLVFILSLLLLPHDSGLGRLLWGAL